MFRVIPKKNFIGITLSGVIILSVSLFLPTQMQAGWVVGYAVGLLAVVFHLVATGFSAKGNKKDFVNYYYLWMIVRFFIVCGIFIILLVVTKIDEFSFTVSFIISYLLNSINEVIFLNQKFFD